MDQRDCLLYVGGFIFGQSFRRFDETVSGGEDLGQLPP